MRNADRLQRFVGAARISAQATISRFFKIATGVDDHSAKKELKSGSLAPPLLSRAARRQRKNQPERSDRLYCLCYAFI
jgi:hypothetical protein